MDEFFYSGADVLVGHSRENCELLSGLFSLFCIGILIGLGVILLGLSVLFVSSFLSVSPLLLFSVVAAS